MSLIKKNSNKTRMIKFAMTIVAGLKNELMTKEYIIAKIISHLSLLTLLYPNTTNQGRNIYGISKNMPAIIVIPVNGLNIYKKLEINEYIFFCLSLKLASELFKLESEKMSVLEKINIPRNPIKREIKLNKKVKVGKSNKLLTHTNVRNNGAFWMPHR